MLARADLGFAIGPACVPREAQNRQQPRLRELVFAELGSIARGIPNAISKATRANCTRPSSAMASAGFR